MQKQLEVLGGLVEKTESASVEVNRAARAAAKATDGFIAWLEAQAPTKTGPSGIGKENYTWSLRNVHLVPLTWDEEVDLLKRELARAHASLRLEEQRNRGLPQLPVISSPEEYQRRANAAITKYLAFLKAKDILPMRDYLDPAMRERIGEFSPEATREFLLDREPLRADDAIHPFLPLVGPGPDARRSTCEPDPTRAAAVQHLG